MDPENKEEVLALLYEFDDSVRAMAQMLSQYKQDDMTTEEKAWTDVYVLHLLGLMKSYNELDQYEAALAQGKEG